MPAREEIAAPGWVIRASGGATKRVNSANPIVPCADVAAVRATVEQAYAARGLPPRFRLTPLARGDVDAVLADAGYVAIDPSFTMIAPIRTAMVDPAVELAPPDACWSAGHAAAVGWSDEQAAVHAAILARLPSGAVAATLVEDGAPVAHGLASVADGHVQLFDIVVVASARGRGLGRRLVAALLGHGAAQGHRRAVLQVLATNAPARHLYASLGFVDAYPYHYRIRR